MKLKEAVDEVKEGAPKLLEKLRDFKGLYLFYILKIVNYIIENSP